MVHFDFVVDEFDAENIMDCVHDGYCNALDKSLLELAKNGESKTYFDMLAHAEYMKQLKSKMKNRKTNKCDK